MFEKIDLDGNGTIDYTEFVMATINEKNLVTNERLLQAFKMFDKDNSGALSYDEIKDVLCFDATVDPKTVQKIIEEVDENGNGEIVYDMRWQGEAYTPEMAKMAQSAKEENN